MKTHQAKIIILITLLQAHFAALAEEQAYQPAEYQPKISYAEPEASTPPARAVPETATEQPAPMSEVVSTAAATLEASGPTPKNSVGGEAKAADSAELAVAENPPPSDSNLALFLMAVLAGAAVWFMRQKTSRQHSADVVSGATLGTASASTGVERYLARQQASEKTGVEKYLARQTDSMPATGVSKYLAKRAASGKN
ncbi:hypothetical protein [Methylomonas rivi]|uniref:PEP-CTERM protein-sorting domain-containing protein n=1 Tax=Methylomonas rivi TaxID=2952226 RepID=A0ABT1U2Y9_9GAMM|nr:hypothetical protein [Methylomonas sp. WSC-6]MCQ8128170.1 hypothetical protein [Methylomonas sp. WSC-6]